MQVDCLLAFLVILLLLLLLPLLLSFRRRTSSPVRGAPSGAASGGETLVLAFTCKNQSQIIEEFLAHHIGEGVSSVLMMDDFSTDDSVELALRLCRDARVPLILLPRLQSTRAVESEFLPLLQSISLDSEWQLLTHGWLLIGDCRECAHWRGASSGASSGGVLLPLARALPGRSEDVITFLDDERPFSRAKSYCVRLPAGLFQEVPPAVVSPDFAVAPRVRRFPFYVAHVISMPAAETRRAHMQTLCLRLGLRAKMVEPVEITEATRRQHQENCACEGYKAEDALATAPSAYSQAWLSLALTHRRILREISEAEDEWHFIFEDDAQLTEGCDLFMLHELLDSIREKQLDADGLVYLGMCAPEKTSELFGDISRGHAWCTHAFAVTPRGAAKVLGQELCWAHPVDQLYAQALPPQLLVGFERKCRETPAQTDWRGFFFQDREASWYSQSLLYSSRPAPAPSPLPITTLITTCCRQNCPSTLSFQVQFRQMRALAPELLEDVIVVFDGARPGQQALHKKCKGACDEIAYGEYVREVVQLGRQACRRFRYLVMPERSCLTSSLRAAMRLVDTHFVYVAQEDLVPSRSLPIQALLRAMTQRAELQLVHTCRVSLGYHLRYCQQLTPQRRESSEPPALRVGDLRFFPGSCYIDQNHVSSVAFYEKHVWPYVRPGDFMEHDLMYNLEQPPAGTQWFLGDSLEDGGFILHLDGRNA